MSEKIPTVGIVEWAVNLPEVVRAHIEFGLDLESPKRAPVALDEPSFRTLLLGMKPSREYQFRIVAQSSEGECASEVHSLVTGPRPNGLPQISVNTLDRAALAPGYIVAAQYSGGPAYILDEEGEFVWWYDIGGEVTSARMSYSGSHMWISKGNVPDTGAKVHRVSMDGLHDEDLSTAFDGQNHSLAVLPDESVAFYAYGDHDCDDIKEYAPDGTVRTIVNAGAAHGAVGACHLNAIEYSPSDDTLIFSDLEHDNYTKVTRAGDVVWVLGGPTSDFTGNAASWKNQHGLHVLGADRLLFFNNGTVGSSGSFAIELSLDLSAHTVTKVWEYGAGLSNFYMGDVQRLDNGNTLMVHSSQGVIHEVDRHNTLIQEMTWASGAMLGYAMKRESLYGAPPK